MAHHCELAGGQSHRRMGWRELGNAAEIGNALPRHRRAVGLIAGILLFAHDTTAGARSLPDGFRSSLASSPGSLLA